VVTDFNDKNSVGSNPMHDLDWVFNELIQWVFFNLMSRWESVLKKGQEKVR
jgi:ribosome-binding ATPase YchF (GTP1/OBG family)